MRSKAGLNQTELGRRLGYKDGSVVSRWENGERLPTPESLGLIGEALGADATELFTARRLDTEGGQMRGLDPNSATGRAAMRSIILHHLEGAFDEIGDLFAPPENDA